MFFRLLFLISIFSTTFQAMPASSHEPDDGYERKRTLRANELMNYSSQVNWSELEKFERDPQCDKAVIFFHGLGDYAHEGYANFIHPLKEVLPKAILNKIMFVRKGDVQNEFSLPINSCQHHVTIA